MPFLTASFSLVNADYEITEHGKEKPKQSTFIWKQNQAPIQSL